MGMTITGDADHDLACLFSPYDTCRTTPPQPVSADVVAVLHGLRDEIIELRDEGDRLRRQLAQALRRDNFGPYLLGWWAAEVTHVEACDCDLDEEVLGDACGKASGARPALLKDERGFAPSFVMYLPEAQR
jgi:hypothetical protein